MDATVPCGMSLFGCGIVTRPGLAGCLNCQWLPLVATCSQPSCWSMGMSLPLLRSNTRSSLCINIRNANVRSTTFAAEPSSLDGVESLPLKSVRVVPWSSSSGEWKAGFGRPPYGNPGLPCFAPSPAVRSHGGVAGVPAEAPGPRRAVHPRDGGLIRPSTKEAQRPDGDGPQTLWGRSIGVPKPRHHAPDDSAN